MDVPVDSEGLSGTPSYGAAGLEVRPLPDRPGVRVSGEVNVGTRPVWNEALDRLALLGEDLLHVEMSQVTFIDVAGVTDLAMAARSLGDSRRLVVEQPPPQLPRVLELLWPDLDGIEVAP